MDTISLHKFFKNGKNQESQRDPVEEDPGWIPRWRGIQSAITTLKMEEEDQEVGNVGASRSRQEP